jgi:hypothetical protein
LPIVLTGVALHAWMSSRANVPEPMPKSTVAVSRV